MRSGYGTLCLTAALICVGCDEKSPTDDSGMEDARSRVDIPVSDSSLTFVPPDARPDAARDASTDAGPCGECEPDDDRRCAGNGVDNCNADCAWGGVDYVCFEGSICEDSEDEEWRAGCVAADTCFEGSRACEQNAVFRCEKERWVRIDICGERTCIGGACVECVQTVEVCNGLDDDCDGEVDEMLTRSCYDGPDDTEEIGQCAGGVQTCAQGDWGQCSGQVTPMLERCDTLDNDCDGETDEGFELQHDPENCGQCGQSCSAPNAIFFCNRGACEFARCELEWADCNGAPEADGCEILGECGPDGCNGIDDDDDGTIDEDFIPTACGIGPCSAQSQCVNGEATECMPGVPLAAMDVSCDGIDDDCDGLPDDDFVGRAAVCGTGGCSSVGVEQCRDGEIVDTCVPGAPAAIDASCDGIDDDCDGTTDEDFAGDAITCGIGACIAAGDRRCVDGEVVDTCAPGVPAADDATCDGIDDDCDGTADENFTGAQTACAVGACTATGVERCIAGEIVDTCAPAESATGDATCNGVDDDCDGSTDEDFAGDATACGTGACAAVGVWLCVSGEVVDTCAPGRGAGDDATCDGIDDDCDGTTDEDFTGIATTCGVGACAATGIEQCAAGEIIDNCAAGAAAFDDPTCDGIDDDCDGTTDEDFTGIATTCGTGACAAAGVEQCVGGEIIDTCAAGVAAADDRTCNDTDDDCDGLTDEGPWPDEACNGIDDNCDDVTDEGYTLGVACTVGRGECVRNGSTICNADGTGTVCSATPGESDVERCGNDIDDDCDGEVDEGFELIGSPCVAGAGDCRDEGTWQCDAVSGQARCDAEPGDPTEDVCDGRDNDCDGAIDGDFDLGARCGVGICAGGIVECGRDLGARCSTMPGGSADASATATALKFDGEDDLVMVPANQSLTTGTAFTIEVWAYWSGLTPGQQWQSLAIQGWISSSRTFSLSVRDDETLHYTSDVGQCGDSSMVGPMPRETWTHIAMVADEDQRRVYVDGRLAAEHLGSCSKSVSEDTPIYFGGNAGCPTCQTDYPWNGRIGSARISSTARYVAGFAPPLQMSVDDDTVALWRFDAGEGETVAEISGRAPAAELDGAQWASDGMSTEICDGLDNDCNGFVDDVHHLELVGRSDFTDDGGHGHKIVWTGTEYGVVWDDTNHVFFARVDSTGSRVGDVVAVTSGGSRNIKPALAWNGNGYGVVWERRSGGQDVIMFASLMAAGETIEITAIPSGPSASDARLSWAGEIQQYGVVWNHNPHAYFIRLSRAGVALGPRLSLSDTPDQAYLPVVAWSGVEFGAAWGDTGLNDVHFTRISAESVELGPDVRITNADGASGVADIVWTGQEYGLTWWDNRNLGAYETFFTRISSDGVKLIDDTLVSGGTSTTWSSLAWIGDAYAILYESPYGVSGDLYMRFVEISAGGVHLGPIYPLTDAGDAHYAWMAWAEREFVIVHGGDARRRAIHGRLGCAPRDDCSDDDATCNGVDDDCDGRKDEDAAVVPIGCGIGVCARTGAQRCVDGSIIDDCVPGLPSGADDDCNGQDDDCDGLVDEDYSIREIGCGVGACASSGESSCIDGVIVESCEPAEPAIGDSLCNGIDDDCDGIVDEDGTPDFVTVIASETAYVNGSASVARTPDQVGVVWTDTRSGAEEIYFARYGHDGQVIGEPRRIRANAYGGEERNPVLAWSGTQFGVVWHAQAAGNDHRLTYAALDESGTTVAGPVEIAAPADLNIPRVLTWTGSDWALAWNNLSNDFFTRIDADGAIVVPHLALQGPRGPLDMAIHGRRVAFTWHGAHTFGLYFAAATLDGVLTTPGRRIWGADQRPVNPRIASHEDGFAILWANEQGVPLMWTAKVDATGAFAREPVAIAELPDTFLAVGLENSDGALRGYWFARGDDRLSRGLIDIEAGTILEPQRLPVPFIDPNNRNTMRPDSDGSRAVFELRRHTDGWLAQLELYFMTDLCGCVPSGGDDNDCNGVDDDCDGDVDEALEPFEVHGETEITPDYWHSFSLVDAETGYAAVWSDQRNGQDRSDIGFARLDADGNVIGGIVRITDDAPRQLRPTVAWNGDGFGIVWEDRRNGGDELYFAALSRTGERLGVDVRLTLNSRADGARLVWAAEIGTYGLVWHNGTDAFFTRVSLDGQIIGSITSLSDTPDQAYLPTVAWTGTEFGVAWGDSGESEVYFTRVSADGHELIDDIRITNAPGRSGVPDLIWTGAEYGLTWLDERNVQPYQKFFARLSPTGEKLSADIALLDGRTSYSGGMAWTGSAYWVVSQAPYAEYSNIFLQHVEPTATGTSVGAVVQLTHAGNGSAPRIRGGAEGFVIAYGGADHRLRAIHGVDGCARDEAPAGVACGHSECALGEICRDGVCIGESPIEPAVVVVVDDETAASGAYESETGSWRLPAGTVDASPGEILWSSLGDGVLGRIEEIRRDGASDVYTLEPVAIAEALGESSLDFALEFSLADAEPPPAGGLGLAYSAHPSDVGAGLGRTVELDGRTLIAGNGVQVDFVGGTVGVDFGFSFHVETRLGLNPIRRFRVDITRSFTLSAGIEATLGAAGSIEFGPVDLLPVSVSIPFAIPTPIAPIPGRAVLNLGAGGSVEADAELGVSYQYDVESTGGGVIEYVRGEGWSVERSEPQLTRGSDGAQLDSGVGAGLEVYVEPYIDLLFFGSGPRLSGRVTGDLDVDFDVGTFAGRIVAQICASLAAGGGVEIWGFELGRWDWELFRTCRQLFERAYCFDACDSGAPATCLDPLTRRSCGEAGDGDDCREWFVDSCGDGMGCEAGACVERCIAAGNECRNGDVWQVDSCGAALRLIDPCSANETCRDGACSCTPGARTGCWGGDVWSYDACDQRERLVTRCINGEQCVDDRCVCVVGDHRSCSGGDVYWFDSCDRRGAVDEICPPGSTCIGDQCVCEVRADRVCAGGDSYWQDACGNIGTLRDRCDGVDEQCDEAQGQCVVVCADADQDGFAAGPCGNDCDDHDEHRFPGNPEVWDIRDNNCDGNQDNVGLIRLRRYYRPWTASDWEHRFAEFQPPNFEADGHYIDVYPPVDICRDPDFAPSDGICTSVAGGQQYRLWGGFTLVALAECTGVLGAHHVSLYLTEDGGEYADYAEDGPLDCNRIGYVYGGNTAFSVGSSVQLWRHRSGFGPQGKGDNMWSADPNEGHDLYDVHEPHWSAPGGQ